MVQSCSLRSDQNHLYLQHLSLQWFIKIKIKIIRPNDYDLTVKSIPGWSELQNISWSMTTKFPEMVSPPCSTYSDTHSTSCKLIERAITWQIVVPKKINTIVQIFESQSIFPTLLWLLMPNSLLNCGLNFLVTAVA